MKKIDSVRLITVLLVPVLGASYAASAENWPGWRGPDMSGLCTDGNPPVKWSEDENIKWKVALEGDESDSSPIIWEDRIYFQSAAKTGKQQDSKDVYAFNVVCMDRNTGKTLWKTTVTEAIPHQGHHNTHGFASFTPVTDGAQIWADFGSRGIYCLDMEGRVKWSRDLGQFKIAGNFGEGGSPVLVGSHIIVLKDFEGSSFIVALNKDTGEVVWKKDRDEKSSWTTPLPVKVGDTTQIIVTGTNSSIAYDAKTGDVIWECRGGHTKNVIPTPVTGLDRVFLISGFRGSKLQAIKLGRTGDLTGTDAVAWEVNEACPYVPSPLLYEGNLYIVTGFKNILSCVNAKTGEFFYKSQVLDEIKDIYASLGGAAGRVYIIGRNGVTYVLKNADTFEILAINKLDDGIDCSPAFYGDELYLKGKKNFYCIADKTAD